MMASFFSRQFVGQQLADWDTTITSSTNSTSIWPIWANQAQTASTQIAWCSWVSSAADGTDVTGYQQRQVSQQEMCAQQFQQDARIAELQVEQQRMRERAVEHERKRQAALARAQALLESYLDAQQRHELKEQKAFRVCAKSGTEYRIQAARGLVGNVEQLDAAGKVVKRLCAHDRVIGLPHGDQLLAQLLYLRHHEADFLRVANVH